jgi:hypothetical protein
MNRGGEPRRCESLSFEPRSAHICVMIMTESHDKLRVITEDWPNPGGDCRDIGRGEAMRVGIPKQQIHQVTGLARTTINRIGSGSSTGTYPCDQCVREHFRRLRREGPPGPVRESNGYLRCRIGGRPEIVAHKLCREHRDRDWAGELPAAARLAWCPHMPKTPSRVVYSLGGIRDDSGLFRDYFGGLPEWAANISFLLTWPSAKE